jgi:hypothetical protein
MIQSPSPDWIITPFPQRPLRLCGEAWFLDWSLAIQKTNKTNSFLQEFCPIWTVVFKNISISGRLSIEESDFFFSEGAGGLGKNFP